MDIGKNIKALREAQRVTQLEIATKLGLDNSSYARIEKKGNKISIEQLEKIAKALEVTPYEILYLEKEQTQAQSSEINKKLNELEQKLKDVEEINKVLLAERRRSIDKEDKLIDAITSTLEFISEKQGFGAFVDVSYDYNLVAIKKTVKYLKEHNLAFYILIGNLLYKGYSYISHPESRSDEVLDLIEEYFDSEFYFKEYNEAYGFYPTPKSRKQ